MLQRKRPPRQPCTPIPMRTPVRAVMATGLDREAPRPDPAPETYRSEAWLAAVRSIPCVHCGQPGEAAHINEGKGTGKKTHDVWTASLCRAEHMRIDQGKDMDRNERRELMRLYVLLTLAELAKAGKLKVTQ